MKKALVIGANGFLGRHLVRISIDAGWRVTAGIHKNFDYIPKGVEIKSLNKIYHEKEYYDVIYLLSAVIPYLKKPISENEMREVNVELPEKVVKKFPKSRIVFSSSISVYGQTNGIIDENRKSINPNYYGQTKLAGEKVILKHPNSSVIRFSSLYGEGMYADTFIPRAIFQALKNKKIMLSGDGSRKQDYLAVSDAVNYLIRCGLSDCRRVLLGVYGHSYTNLEVAEIILGYINDTKIEYIGEESSLSYIFNNRISQKILDYKPKINLNQGIKDLLASKI